MWVRSAAIRPVPPFARIAEIVVEGVRDGFVDDDEARERLDTAFDEFERSQPALSAKVGEMLGRPMDDTALALGYFLVLATWLIFSEAHAERLTEVTDDVLRATEESLDLDEQLRISDPTEALESEDVIAMQQPAVLEFIHEHVDATLEAHAEDVEVDDVHAVYRMVLIEVLALSYSVRAPEGFPLLKTELLA